METPLTKPNILFITADQLRFDSLGCTGHPLVQTPTIDQLAAEGTMFTRAYVQSPVCGPSRASLYTGRYVHSHRSRFNEVPLGAGEKTIADYFNSYGYRSALVGRTHFTPITETYGFEYFAYYDGLPAKDSYSQYPYYLKEMGYSEEDIKRRYWPRELDEEAGEQPYPEDFREALYPCRIAEEHSDTAYLTNEAIRFMRETTDRPWMLHLSYWKPHLPFSVSEPYHSMYDPEKVPMPKLNKDELLHKPPLQKIFREERRGNYVADEALLKKIRAVYYGMITQLDTHLGRLFNYMKQIGVLDNTLIVFTSDHGEYLGDHHMIEKELFYEQAIHVPLVMRLPDLIPAQHQVSEFIELIDILPTLMDACQFNIPPAIEGQSFIPLLKGETVECKKEVYAEWDFQYYHCRHQLELKADECKAIMVRNERWKYVHYNHQPCELYDMLNDPDEFYNLAENRHYQEVVRELQLNILNWRMRKEDKEPQADLTFATYLRNPWQTEETT